MIAATSPDPLAMERRIELLLQREQKLAQAPRVSHLRRVFGGNARQAWAFEAEWDEPSGLRHLPCILLSQVPGGHVASDVTAEYGVLAALTGHAIRAPSAIALDAAGDVTGAPAIILERFNGSADAVAFLKPKNPAVSKQLTLELADVTADLHQFDWRNSGLATHSDTDAPLTQIEQWEQRYFDGRLHPHPPLTHLFHWLKDHLPEPAQLSLVHGDLRPGNFLYEEGRITALLDWEMAHIGDPAEDLAWIYRSLWSPEKFVPLEVFARRYEARAGAPVDRERLAYYRIFSEVKFATLSIIASASFASGKTANFRYADRAAKVPGSLANCFAWIAAGRWNARDVAA
jgi:aminoglycoside phosphotransferase (APT) family kinase protein